MKRKTKKASPGEQRKHDRKHRPKSMFPRLTFIPVLRAIKDFWASVEIEEIVEHEEGALVMRAKKR